MEIHPVERPSLKNAALGATHSRRTMKVRNCKGIWTAFRRGFGLRLFTVLEEG